jgi:hypothetical protein
MRVVLQNAAALLLGTTCFPLPPAQCGWLILGGMIVNRNVTGKKTGFFAIYI